MSDESKREEKPVELTAKIILIVADDGQFVADYCGKCGSIINGNLFKCPACGIKLEGTELGPSFGGSDF